LPGTTSWSTDFAGRPTALWVPQVLTPDANFGVRTSQFGFTLVWSYGMTVVLDACTNLANHTWQAVNANTLISGSSYFSDPQWKNYPARFYRLRFLLP
jgi:hypothetical protein